MANLPTNEQIRYKGKALNDVSKEELLAAVGTLFRANIQKTKDHANQIAMLNTVRKLSGTPSLPDFLKYLGLR